MKINKLSVKGELEVEFNFGEINILLGENKTGKSTFFKLILYALGTYIESFIDEIKKEKLCKQVELDITCKTGNKFRIIRRLPYSESVIVLPLNIGNIPDEENMNAFNLDEFSDFLLNEEGYKSQPISYGKNQYASFRYYFLLRAAVVDQDTPAYKILTDLGGKGKDYINNQSLIKKAIIEAILEKENEQIQKLRLELQSLMSMKKEKSMRLGFIREMINDKAKEEKLEVNINKITEQLKDTKSQKEQLLASKLEHLSDLEKVNKTSKDNEILVLEKQKHKLNEEIRKLTLEHSDLMNIKLNFQNEIKQLKKMMLARQVLTNIPVDRCPICLGYLNIDGQESNGCPICGNKSEYNIDNVLRFKKMIDESLLEAEEIEKSTIIKIDVLTKELNKVNYELRERMNSYINSLGEQRKPIENLLNKLMLDIEQLSSQENELKSYLELLELNEQLRMEKVEIDSDINKIREKLGELEQLHAWSDSDKVAQWRNLFEELLNFVYGDINSVNLDGNYMPLVDNNEIRSVSSASLKVAARLTYILSLFQLQEHIPIKHLGFVIFDSPRDKDLDIDKYERFIQKAFENSSGQVFITGNVNEKHLFNSKYILNELYENKKLLI